MTDVPEPDFLVDQPKCALVRFGQFVYALELIEGVTVADLITALASVPPEAQVIDLGPLEILDLTLVVLDAEPHCIEAISVPDPPMGGQVEPPTAVQPPVRDLYQGP